MKHPHRSPFWLVLATVLLHTGLFLLLAAAIVALHRL